MAKIPNWSRVNKKTMRSNQLIWKHDEEPIRIAVMEEEPGWIIRKGKRKGSEMSGSTVWNRRLKNPNNRSGLFSTKEMARKSAVKWMKNHPNG